MIVVVSAKTIGSSVGCSRRRRRRSAGNAQIRPCVRSNGIAENVSLLGVNQHTTTLLIVTSAGISGRRSFHRGIGSSPTAGDWSRGIVYICGGDIRSAKAPLPAEKDNLPAGIVILQKVSVACSGRAACANLRPDIRRRIVLPRIVCCCSAGSGKTSVHQDAIYIRHVDHRAFLAIAGVKRRSCSLRPCSGTCDASMRERKPIVAKGALA